MTRVFKRVFISTGEVSGDLQGALLVAALKRQAEARSLDLEIVALGGDRMAATGATLLGNTSAIGSMGIVESLPFVLPTLTVQKQAKTYLKDHPPDLVVLIDYMGPNLAFCEYFPTAFPGVPIVYYIAPQEWVWGNRWPWGVKLFRSDRIVQATQKILAIFPKEATYYQAKGGNVAFVGHPLVDRMAKAPSRSVARQALGIAEDEVAIALLPASRRQELQYLLPILFEAARLLQAKLPTVRFWIPLALEQYRSTITAAIESYGLNATLLNEPASGESGAQSVKLQAIAAADLAISKSGTPNLEIALLNVPQIVMYRMHPFTAWILEHVLKFNVPFVSPPNLVDMQPIVPEFLQYQAKPAAIAEMAMELLHNPQRRDQMQQGYAQMRQSLGEVGVCDRAAQEILDLL